MAESLAVVLAAGKGTRMESDLPKVLCEVRGRPMVEYVLDALQEAGVARQLVVVGYQADRVRELLAGRPGVSFVEQREQLGTGHAVQVCRQQLAEHDGAVVVLAGDSPLTQSRSLRALLDEYWRDRPACVIGTVAVENPTGLGRIVRDAEGRFQAIVEERDATAQQRQLKEVNMSTYVFDATALCSALTQLQNQNDQGEYYITDCPGILTSQGQAVRALQVLQPCEALSINTRADLAAVEAELTRLESD